MRFVLSVFLALFTLTAHAAEGAPPIISALLTHETVNKRGDGVTETTVYQERYLRAEDTVWVERVMPAVKPGAVAQPEVAGEHGPNLQTLSRWVRPSADGGATLSLVNRAERYVVAIKSLEFGRLGFGGIWAAERSLIDPASLKGMQPSTRAAQQPDARWFEATRKGRYSRVLWSERLQLPLAIETGSVDGHTVSRTTVELQAAPTQLPWVGLSGYAIKEVDDFGD